MQLCCRSGSFCSFFLVYWVGNLVEPNPKIVLLNSGNHFDKFKMNLIGTLHAGRKHLILQKRYLVANAVNRMEDSVDSGSRNPLSNAVFLF